MAISPERTFQKDGFNMKRFIALLIAVAFLSASLTVTVGCDNKAGGTKPGATGGTKSSTDTKTETKAGTPTGGEKMPPDGDKAKPPEGDKAKPPEGDKAKPDGDKKDGK
jgi:hypothetical protein